MKHLLNISLLICTLSFFTVYHTKAQNNLSLDSCRSLALKNNKELKISNKELQIAGLKQKSARTNYYPKVSAMGTYMRSEKELSLLSNQQKNTLKHLGTQTGEKLQSVRQILAQKYPTLAPILEKINNQAGAILVPALDQVGNSLVESLRTDTRNLYVGAVNITQPIFVGGKIKAYNRITDYLQQIATNKNALSTQEVILQTDQTYWLVVSLSNKKKLADSYAKLLAKMESDVEKMIAEGVATKADGLTVKVKANEAAMLQTKANNGLQLAKMALCQICGLSLEAPVILADEAKTDLSFKLKTTESNLNVALRNRPELQSLTLAGLAKKEQIKVERAEFLPQVALSGNYLVTNPATSNGFENKFKGMWSVGVQVKIPIWHWGEGTHKVNIAKAEADVMEYKLEEVKEKIMLQVSQANFRVGEAKKQLKMAEKNREKAEENLRYAKLGFKEGVIPPGDVLKAHTAWYDAQSEKIDAQIQIKLSEVALSKALGTLTAEQ